jgi:hypothetical protein
LLKTSCSCLKQPFLLIELYWTDMSLYLTLIHKHNQMSHVLAIQAFNISHNKHKDRDVHNYNESVQRGADKSLTRPTFRCILFDDENSSFGASLVIYT